MPGSGGTGERSSDPGLPFEFTAGYVGYFGYEMKADCGAYAAHRARTPDAMWIFASAAPSSSSRSSSLKRVQFGVA